MLCNLTVVTCGAHTKHTVRIFGGELCTSFCELPRTSFHSGAAAAAAVAAERTKNRHTNFVETEEKTYFTVLRLHRLRVSCIACRVFGAWQQ